MIVMVTRRTLRRTHLLQPDPELKALYTYCLAVVAERHGIDVHAAVVMSTHEHLVVTDTRGQLPLFLQELHRLIALAVKSLRKWEGAVWDHEKTSIVELRTPHAIIEKIAYVMANPVAAGLVYSADEWDGLMTLPRDLGAARWTAARPSFYFDDSNPRWPDSATLELRMPRTDLADLRAEVIRELEYQQAEARERVQSQGRSFPKKRARLRPSSAFRRAESWEPLRGRNPTFAVGRGQRDALLHAVAALKSFRLAYASALRAWRSGVRDALFPPDTWLMRWAHGAAVGAAVGAS